MEKVTKYMFKAKSMFTVILEQQKRLNVRYNLKRGKNKTYRYI